MVNSQSATIRYCVEHLQAVCHQIYEGCQSDYLDLIGQTATLALNAIALSDMPYHNLEHTILVTTTGQEMLRGKYLLEGNISCQDWVQVILALVCHDLGYVRGVCQHDRISDQGCCYATGIGSQTAYLPLNATDAGLAPYHVDRGKQFIEEHLSGHPLIDVEAIKLNIELTRFPFPDEPLYQDTSNFPGLVRAADLIGQLSDPCYLEKLPDLFCEFEEIGTNQMLGYRHPRDLRSSYPSFYRNVVYPYIREGIYYLKLTRQGRKTLAHLYENVAVVENELVAV
ncbi:metal-dependent phosphohydrolase [Phormidesmis priestleyi ULC007]|uniref:Metal-dependent phosphohydrolase n=1 Tax=Phormidesmis priestleyi ULC007 TaxID=1920490 RepID=A0A2T1DHL5_9CYAN|nr:metal-dependent phosphohydrolase [Phormidesmis priestleyi]PSB19973.1 metal-dependent phosphohydrolase [Phormidesmis priestleyi ULC007]PZO50329.1 MAG: metal-dependent phosphohydrolase [Phormidesmis priestleyi]